MENNEEYTDELNDDDYQEEEYIDDDDQELLFKENPLKAIWLKLKEISNEDD